MMTGTIQQLGQRVLEVGERLRDGTVVFSVDLDKKEALCVPGMVIVGSSWFYYQDKVVEAFNGAALHGHKDWRQIKTIEGIRLTKVWDKVAPAELQGSNAPRFWYDLPNIDGSYGAVSRGYEPVGLDLWDFCPVDEMHPVTIVRRVTPWSLDV